MEEIRSSNINEGGGTENSGNPARWWAAASAAQLGWAIRTVRRGPPGNSSIMPIKAFGVGTLFVSGFATAFMAILRASGIHTVEDMKAVGSSIRTALGPPPRKQVEDIEALGSRIRSALGAPPRKQAE